MIRIQKINCPLIFRILLPCKFCKHMILKNCLYLSFFSFYRNIWKFFWAKNIKRGSMISNLIWTFVNLFYFLILLIYLINMFEVAFLNSLRIIFLFLGFLTCIFDKLSHIVLEYLAFAFDMELNCFLFSCKKIFY